MRTIIATLILIVAAGCSAKSMSTKMASWQGSHIDDLSRVWGKPDRCMTRDGRKLCTWSQIAVANSGSTPSQSFGRVPTCVRTVEVDSSGVITGWHWRGDRCSDMASQVLARSETKHSEVLAAGQRPSTVELAVIEPAETPTIGRTR